MAGHAPQLLTPRERLSRWLDESSDLRLSLVMLAVALAVAGMVFAFVRALAG